MFLTLLPQITAQRVRRPAVEGSVWHADSAAKLPGGGGLRASEQRINRMPEQCSLAEHGPCSTSPRRLETTQWLGVAVRRTSKPVSCLEPDSGTARRSPPCSIRLEVTQGRRRDARRPAFHHSAGVTAGVCAVIVHISRVQRGDWHHDQHIGRAKLMINDCAVADIGTKAQVSLDERR